MLRHGNRCYLCGQPFDEDDPPEIEHVIPRSTRRNDVESMSNKRIAHRSCNRTKGTHAVAVD